MLSVRESICVSPAANVSGGHLLQNNTHTASSLCVCNWSTQSQTTPSKARIAFSHTAPESCWTWGAGYLCQAQGALSSVFGCQLAEVLEKENKKRNESTDISRNWGRDAQSKKESNRGGNLGHIPDAERLIGVVMGWMWRIWQHLVARLQVARIKLHFLNALMSISSSLVSMF